MAKYLTEQQHDLVMDILYVELHNRTENGEETLELVKAIDHLDDIMVALGYGEDY